jgi:hypothetical protein
VPFAVSLRHLLIHGLDGALETCIRKRPRPPRFIDNDKAENMLGCLTSRFLIHENGITPY